MSMFSRPASSLLTLLSIGVAAASFVPAHGAPAPATPYKAGDQVEVREGDEWSAVTLQKKEGRKYQIQYEDGTEEWVTTDRLRPVGGAPAAKTPGATKPKPAAAAGTNNAKPAPAAVKPPKPAVTWKTGQEVEVKWGGLYRKAKIKNKAPNGWVLVIWDNNVFYEWVEPWRIRAVGSEEDEIGYAQPGKTLRKPEAPPKQAPGNPPADPHARHGAGGGGAGGGGDKPKEDPAAAYKDDPTFKEADWSGAEALDLIAENNNWTITPDPAPAEKLPQRNIGLRGGTGEHWERINALVVGRGANPVVLVAHGSVHGDAEVRLERVSLAQTKSLGASAIGKGVRPLDVSPDGKRILMRSNAFGPGKSDRVEIWSIEGSKPTKQLMFLPFNEFDWTKRDVRSGMFIDDQHVLLTGNSGKMGLFNITTARAVYSATVHGDSRPALSPGGKYLALGTNALVVIIDPKTGKALAELPADKVGGAALSFSPSGKRLAAIRSGNVSVWDVGTGNLVTEFTLKIAGSRLEMLNDDYGMMDGAYLVSLAHRIPLWHYTDASASAVTPGGRFLFVTKDDKRGLNVLASTELPHPGALALAKKLVPEALLLMKPGSSVSVQVNIQGTEEERQKILNNIKKQLADRQIQVADAQQPVQIIASTSTGKSEERQYRAIGVFGGTEKVTVTEQKSRLAIEHNGKVAWEANTSVMPGFFLNIKQGQTIAQAVADAQKPNLSFLWSTQLPATLTLPRDPAWYGAGRLTAQGVEDAPVVAGDGTQPAGVPLGF